ncbi:hypothetical protein DMUE_2176 [Dictyocoela muelleri]|nr:hypothetical protein DMUE_2176 [Dictyocoela muelleri]
MRPHMNLSKISVFVISNEFMNEKNCKGYFREGRYYKNKDGLLICRSDMKLHESKKEFFIAKRYAKVQFPLSTIQFFKIRKWRTDYLFYFRIYIFQKKAYQSTNENFKNFYEIDHEFENED